jgi:hypothetical protein
MFVPFRQRSSCRGCPRNSLASICSNLDRITRVLDVGGPSESMLGTWPCGGRRARGCHGDDVIALTRTMALYHSNGLCSSLIGTTYLATSKPDNKSQYALTANIRSIGQVLEAEATISQYLGT